MSVNRYENILLYFITHLFTITCNHLILLLSWNILNSHLKNLKSPKGLYWQYHALLHYTKSCLCIGLKNVFYFCLQLNFLFFLPPFTSTQTSIEDTQLWTKQFRPPFHYIFFARIQPSHHTILKSQYIFFL
jgi:hypothetical protein